MRNISIPVYSFGELSLEAREKVLERFRYAKVEGDVWSTMLIEDTFIPELATLGYPDAEIKFSGFYRQGDGASFTCDNVDIKTVCNLLKIELPQSFLDWYKEQNICLAITRFNRQYSHENTISTEWMTIPSDIPEQFDNLMTEIEKRVTADAREESRKIYKALQEEYEFLTTDEAVKDSVCDLEFTADGELAPEENK